MCVAATVHCLGTLWTLSAFRQIMSSVPEVFTGDLLCEHLPGVLIGVILRTVIMLVVL